MIQTLHHLITPLATLLFSIWAAWLSLAGEADAEVPRILADQRHSESDSLPPVDRTLISFFPCSATPSLPYAHLCSRTSS